MNHRVVYVPILIIDGTLESKPSVAPCETKWEALIAGITEYAALGLGQQPPEGYRTNRDQARQFITDVSEKGHWIEVVQVQVPAAFSLTD